MICDAFVKPFAKEQASLTKKAAEFLWFCSGAENHKSAGVAFMMNDLKPTKSMTGSALSWLVANVLGKLMSKQRKPGVDFCGFWERRIPYFLILYRLSS